ncbi:hypothetical protein M9458_039613, partial [Cirrhinus mrigala]
LISSVWNALLASSHAAGIPKPTHLCPPVFELFPLSVALSTMGIALWCVWAAYTTAETPEKATSTEGLPEAAAEATEPPEAVVPIPDPPEVAAYAAEPPEAASSISALVIIVASTCELLVRPDPASEAVYECPVMAVEAVCELSSCSDTAMEAICELRKLLPCPELATKAECEPTVRLGSTDEESETELSVCPNAVVKTECELSVGPDLIIKSNVALNRSH